MLSFKLLKGFFLLLAALFQTELSDGTTISIKAKETLTGIELNVGDTLLFTLKNAEVRRFILKSSEVSILYTTLKNTKIGAHGNGSIYSIKCQMDVDGQLMEIERFIPGQEAFYEPYVVNGVRIWFDGLKEIGNYFNENHGDCLPGKDARFAMQDATLSICPERIQPWYPNADNLILARDNYNGDDAWMGPYFGSDLHGGLDINMPIGTYLWAPVSIDDHYYFNSLKAGDNNNRWRGFHKWKNGDTWIFQTHHLVDLLVPEHTPIKAGETYAITAGVRYGDHPHTHFVFKLDQGRGEIFLDPWIIFWQIFETNKERSNTIKAAISPLKHAKTGEVISFSSSGSRIGVTGNKLSYYWTFGDGGFSMEPNPDHIFAEPGVYPVTLVVDDGVSQASFTQHITINKGSPIKQSLLVLQSPEEISFQSRNVSQMDVYGKESRYIPHTLVFTARPHGNYAPSGKEVVLLNKGHMTLPANSFSVEYKQGNDWLNIVPQGQGNNQRLLVTVDARKLPRISAADPPRLPARNGRYEALVKVSCNGAVNSPQYFRVELHVPADEPAESVIIDNEHAACTYTPWYWICPRFNAAWSKGYGGTYLLNGTNRPTQPAFVRFTPDLASGSYRIKLISPDSLPNKPEINGFFVRVYHQGKLEKLWVEPDKQEEIGVFTFSEGTDGYVEITTEEAQGLMVIDAILFEKMKE